MAPSKCDRQRLKLGVCPYASQEPGHGSQYRCKASVIKSCPISIGWVQVNKTVASQMKGLEMCKFDEIESEECGRIRSPI